MAEVNRGKFGNNNNGLEELIIKSSSDEFDASPQGMQNRCENN